MTNDSPIILAVDTKDLETAKQWVNSTTDSVGVYKLGLEFFLKFGATGIRAVRNETDKGIFLDLKLHDIPNTVLKAAEAVSDLHPNFLTVHATGGSAMIASAVQALPLTQVTAVTILTSLDDADLSSIGFSLGSGELVPKLASMAVSSGAKAIVCSPNEIARVRAVVSKEISIITPGVRPLSTTGTSNIAVVDDQKRILDPKSALLAGANYLVIGRPITSAADMRQAAAKILEEALG